LFDRPISTGFTVFSSRYSFDQAKQAALLTGRSVSVNPAFVENYNTNSTGFTIFASYPIKRLSFTRIGLNYGFTKTNITTFNDASKLLFTATQFRSIAGPSALNGIVSSTITPTITYNTINHPVNPTGGKSYFYSAAFQGGPLGGNVNTITNVFEYKMFHPVNKKRNVLGYRFTTAYTTGFGGKGVPPFSRFYMGGEQDLRGFDIRSVSPVTFIPTATATTISYHNPFAGGILTSFTVPVLTYSPTLPGGDYQGTGNLEYRIPILGPVTAALFADVGTDGIIKKNSLRLDPSGFQNLLQNFPTSGVSQTLPIAPGTNFRLRGSTGIEFVVQLPIIQAPFRIYYAYNVHRLYQEIVSPTPFIDQKEKDFLKNAFSFDPNIYNLQIKPQLDFIQQNPGRLNYFEPSHAFRFTVSRTF
jgi:outer membrane protein insertion porin family